MITPDLENSLEAEAVLQTGIALMFKVSECPSEGNRNGGKHSIQRKSALHQIVMLIAKLLSLSEWVTDQV